MARKVPTIDGRLTELLTPYSNEATITPAENMLASVSSQEPFSLEIASTSEEHRFLLRSRSAQAQQQLKQQAGTAYPQADMWAVGTEGRPELDPAHHAPSERSMTAVLHLCKPEYLPVRTFQDVQVEDDRNAQADPALNVLNSAADLPEGFRTLSQLVLRSAPANWPDGYRHLAERQDFRTEGGGPDMFGVVMPLAPAVGGLALAWTLYDEGKLLQAIGAGCAGVLFTIAVAVFFLRMGRKPHVEPEQVREKISRQGYYAQLRISVFASADGLDPQELWDRMYDHLERLVSSYNTYNLGGQGNGFHAEYIDSSGLDLRTVEFVGGAKWPVLNVRELAGLWHLPQTLADVHLLKRTGAKKILPMPALVSHGTYYGESRHQDRRIRCHLRPELTRGHMFALAKAGRGKSTWEEHMACAVMRDPDRGLFFVDPHSDAARRLAGLVPLERRKDTIYIRLNDLERPIGLNLLDAGLGWERDDQVSIVMRLFQIEGGDSWGPRIEPTFRWVLNALFEANQKIIARDPENGRDTQYTILDIPHMFLDGAFCEAILADVDDYQTVSWWKKKYWEMSEHNQTDWSSSIENKIARFAGTYVGRRIVGQPRSTVEPKEWLRDRKIVILDTAAKSVGTQVSALVGAMLINLISVIAQKQVEDEMEERGRLTIIIDEFQNIPGVEYETIMNESRKFGVNLILATQSLAQLAAVDTANTKRLLVPRVASTVDTLLVFECNAEDARYMIEELGTEVTKQDILRLRRHECYVRCALADEKMPVYHVSLAAPLPSDPEAARALAGTSANAYGTPRTVVDQALVAAQIQVRTTAARGKVRKESGKQSGKKGIAPSLARVPVDPLLDDEEFGPAPDLSRGTEAPPGKQGIQGKAHGGLRPRHAPELEREPRDGQEEQFRLIAQDEEEQLRIKREDEEERLTAQVAEEAEVRISADLEQTWLRDAREEDREPVGVEAQPEGDDGSGWYEGTDWLEIGR